MNVWAIVDGKNLRDFHASYLAGNSVEALPYSMERLVVHGIQLRSVLPPAGLAARVLGPIEYQTGVPLLYPLSVARAAGRADAILTLFEDQAILLGYLKRLGLLKAKLVVVSCWLAQNALSYPYARVDRYARSLPHADAVVCFSGNQTSIMTNRLGIDPSRIKVVPFGIDPKFAPYNPAELEPSYVLAAGSDRGRDYATLADAARMTPDTAIKLVAGPGNVRGIELPPNVEFVGEVSRNEYRRLLAGCATAMVPTHPFAYPTGQTVLLEAMMMGKPVIVTDSPAMRDYVNTDVAFPVRAGDATALANACNDLISSRSRRRQLGDAGATWARSRFTTDHMWDAIAAELTGRN